MNEKTFAQILGEELRNLRKSQGWTQGELAQKASNLLPDDEIIRQNDISSFENTGGTLSLNKIHAAFSVLGKNLTISEKKTMLMSGSIPKNSDISSIF